MGWDHDEKSFIIKGVEVPLGGSDEEGPGRVIALESTFIPTGGEALVLSGRNRTNSGEYLGVLTPERPFIEQCGLAIASALVDSKNPVIYTRIFNLNEEDVKIYRYTHIALFTPIYKVGPVFELQTSNRNVEQVEVTDSLITDIPDHLRDVFINGCEHFNETQAKTFKCIVSKHNCVAKQGEKGRTNRGYHEIKLHDKNLSGNLQEEFHYTRDKP